MVAAKKRREPEPVPPIEFAGMRYEAPLAGSPYGYQQDGGIVVARDLKNNTLVWTQRIYATEYGDDIEEDKQEVFIARMVLTTDNGALHIQDEQGVEYRLSLTDRSVVRIAAHD